MLSEDFDFIINFILCKVCTMLNKEGVKVHVYTIIMYFHFCKILVSKPYKETIQNVKLSEVVY